MCLDGNAKHSIRSPTRLKALKRCADRMDTVPHARLSGITGRTGMEMPLLARAVFERLVY
jgi:hypothetical protein